MPQPTGYNQFSNYSTVPGQAANPQGRQGGMGIPRSWQPGRTGQTPGAENAQRSSGQYPQGTFQQPSTAPAAAPSAQTPPATGAAGQTPPDSTPTTQNAPQTQTYAGLGQQAAPAGHAELGNQGDPGAWTNGYNPHWVQDPQQPAPMPPPPAAPAAGQYPTGTFTAPQRRPMPPMPAPAATPAASAPPAFSNDISWMTRQADRAAAAGPSGVNPMSGEGWKDGMSPQGFQAANPYYGQTGYYGDLGQVQAQMAGGAQSAGIPTGVLGASTYTQNPTGQPAWQPAMTPQQQAAQDLASWEATRWG